MTVQKEFNLPNHNNELSKAEDAIEKVKIKHKKIIKDGSINNEKHELIFETTVRVLNYVGGLSMSVFAVEDELKKLYLVQYPKAPKLAKQLFYEHYENIHYPYNLLKNRCFRLLEELEEEYKRVYKIEPPNYN